MASGAGQDEKAQHTEQKMTIHQREDSASELEALFDFGLNKAQRPLSIPMKMRNLPPSFFVPPTVGSKSPLCHSRENSLDNSGPFSPGGPGASPHPQPLAQPQGPGPQGHHSRANSCPATLGQTLAVAQQHQVRDPFHTSQSPLVSSISSYQVIFYRVFFCSPSLNLTMAQALFKSFFLEHL